MKKVTLQVVVVVTGYGHNIEEASEQAKYGVWSLSKAAEHQNEEAEEDKPTYVIEVK